MTIKWVKVDPLVMNGEPFCYGTRLTVRDVLQMRAHGLTPADMLAEHPELRRVGIAEAFRFATQHPQRYGAYLGSDGALQGPGFSPAEAAGLPGHLRGVPGMVASVSIDAHEGSVDAREGDAAAR
jgi:uncharacterized protein (DUF433 family)